MFCKYCGTQLSDDSLFCSKCGKAVNEAQDSSSSTFSYTSEVKKYKVTIFRESQMYLVNPPVNISINNKKNLSIANGATIDLDLEEGEYDFEFSCSFRKRALKLKLDKDVLITVKWNRITGALVTEVSY